jgi:ribonuclease D
MQYRFFVIPLKNPDEAVDDLNRFLRSSRVLSVQKEFVAQGDNSFWTLAVECLEVKPGRSGEPAPAAEPAAKRIDYKDVLSDADFAWFVKLRLWRKEIAAQVGLPVFAVLTNEQLAAIARLRPTTVAELQKVDGIGEGKSAKYGASLLAVFAQPE